MARLTSTLGLALLLMIALPTSGTADCSFVCYPKFVSATANLSGHNYLFMGSCETEKSESCDEAMNGKIEIAGSWNIKTQEANEVATLDNNYSIAHSWTCPADPWLNDVWCTTVACTDSLPFYVSLNQWNLNCVSQKPGTFWITIKNGKTLSVKLAAERQELKKQQAFTPVILLPDPNQSFLDAVEIKVRVPNGLTKVNFDFQYVLGTGWVSPWAGKEPLKEMDIPIGKPGAEYVDQGLKVPTTRFPSKGKWRVRAVSPWPPKYASEWREFAIAEAQPKKFELPPGAGQKPSEKPSPRPGPGQERKLIQEPPTRPAPSPGPAVLPGIQPQPVPTPEPGPIQRR